MTLDVTATCPRCAASVEPGHNFCEECGWELAPGAAASATAPVPVPGAPAPGEEIGGLGGASAVLEAALERARVEPPRRPGVQVVDVDLDSLPASCVVCPGTIAPDGYCVACGAPAPRPRDHWSEQPAGWVALVCDRGVRHTINQDGGAIAASTEPGGFAAMVVCDGVSSSARSEVASLAAARAARDVLAAPRPAAEGAGSGPEQQPAAGPEHEPEQERPVGSTSVQSRSSALAAALRDAGAAAQAKAVDAASDPPEHNPPACTFVAAVLEASTLVVGWVGDSRAYWLPDRGIPLQLSTDDSWAAEAMAFGFSREEAERAPQAHSITRWLGVDAPDTVPRTVARRVEEPGWLLLCSDGLWNYASEAADLGDVVRAAVASGGGEPLRLAADLVDWAVQQGGHDNITVALARVG